MAPGIRRVNVELLRRGPRHNQLLSPLTDYLAVCGDFPGGVVHVPYEQAEVQNLLDDLRYEVDSIQPSDRLDVVRDRAGTDIAAMLADVPGLAGVLAGERADSGSLTHLRLVVSSSELALLPFELSKVPVGAGSVGDAWLALQPDRPVCLTRHVRGVAAVEGWPTTPRILFVSGDDVPFERHLDAFERVLEPWRLEPAQRVDGARRWASDLLTVIERASLEEIRELASEESFTHVHVLAHGAEVEHRRSVRYGLSLGDRVVTGGDLALALSSTAGGEGRLPSVVTLASCDSGQQGSVVTPGGSVAHDLHASGIPLVVASQFPISEDASVPFVETFYAGQLAGEHPFATICEVRRRLATQFPDEHAWASIVVYEALPGNFDAALEELHYWQARRAHETALVRLEREIGDEPTVAVDVEQLVGAVTAAAEDLPTGGTFGAECDGLRAAGHKRIAEARFRLAAADDADTDQRAALLARCFDDLDAALELYTSTMRAVLANAEDHPHRKVTIHWIAGQVGLLSAIVGAERDADLAGVARLTARLDLDHDDPAVRGWAMVSMIEQALVELATAGPSPDVSAEAVRRASELLRAMGDESEHVMTTCRQMRRYTQWWGDPEFVAALADLGIERAAPWDGDGGVLATAQAIVDVLAPVRRRAPRHRTSTDRQARTPAPHGGATSSLGPQVTAARTARKEPARQEQVPKGSLRLELLPARNGDCVWLTYGESDSGESDGGDHHVLVDCGSVEVATTAAARVASVREVELFLLTHIDADHISGAIPLFEEADTAARFGDVWFNGWKQLRRFLSVAQGEDFSAQLDRDDRPFTWNGTPREDDPPPPIVTDGTCHPVVELAGGMRLTVLSPTPSGLRRLARHWHSALRELEPGKALLGRRPRRPLPADPASLDLVALAASGPTKDTSVPNLSSIAVLAEYGGRAVLLTGDAHADVLAASIRTLQAGRGLDGERLRLDALKLSHHGSANATTRELLELVECRNYLIPTDGSIFGHPDPEAIARVIVHGGPEPVLHFNYRTELNELWGDADLQRRYGYRAVHPDVGESGLALDL